MSVSAPERIETAGRTGSPHMEIIHATTEQDGRTWQEFVERQPWASHFHRWGWKQVIERSFRWPTFYLMARENGQVRGILPLVWQKSLLFGNFLTSLPFVNAGGTLAESRDATDALVAEAITISQRCGARSLELRYRQDPGLDLPTKTNKVTLVRPLSSDPEALMNSLHKKVRSDIRKAEKNGLSGEVRTGGEFLSTFYEIFADNMRNLGTPCYGKKFFAEVLRAFPDDTHLCLVYHDGKPIGTSFILGYRDTAEAMWSASLYSHSKLKPNMMLYWKILCFAGERGYTQFDFGRSSIGSGTHKFKLQWETTEVPLHWAYWLADGNQLPELNPENPKYKLAISLWQKLPVGLTKLLGPPIVRRLP